MFKKRFAAWDARSRRQLLRPNWIDGIADVADDCVHVGPELETGLAREAAEVVIFAEQSAFAGVDLTAYIHNLIPP